MTDPAQIPALLTRDLRDIRIAWSPDLGLPVEPEVLEVLAPARQVLAELAGSVRDVAPDLSGADEVFRTVRAFRLATFYRELLEQHPGQVGANMTWNIQRGLELTVADLSRATALRTALAERVSEFFADVDVLACPVSQVAPFDVTLDWVHEINGQPQQTYLDWMASAYLISATGLPAASVPAGFTGDGRRWACSWWAGAGPNGTCSPWPGPSRPRPVTRPSCRPGTRADQRPARAHPHSEPRLSARAGDVLANCYTSGFKQPMR